jgi:hypothetical protein
MIGLRTSTSSPSVGDELELDIYGTGFENGTDGGDVWIEWFGDLEFVDLRVDTPPWDFFAADTTFVGNGIIPFLDVFSLFDTPGVGGVEFAIATLTLRGVTEGDAGVRLASSSVGWSLAGELLADVDYGVSPLIHISDATPVPTPVPLPASAWLLGSGLCLLVRFRRRQRAS